MTPRKYITNETAIDQYYTRDEVVDECLSVLFKEIKKPMFTYLEPSAGSGSFSDKLKNVIAFDLYPRKDYIVCVDFLKITPQDIISKKPICVIGNPPFGRNASLAIKFFNKCAELDKVKYIAFIIPKSFRKVSVQNKLSINFSLLKDIDLPRDSFIRNGLFYDVPCCFQIWVRTGLKREKITIKKNSKHFDFVDATHADFAVRRVGGKAGYVERDNIIKLKPNCNYFIKSKIGVKKLIDVIESINFKEIVNNTAGVRSLSKHELIIETEVVINGTESV